MIEITLQVNKKLVYNEVAKTTAYAGSKQVTDDDVSAYERIFTTDDDRLMLERFWIETANAATEQFKPFIVTVSNHPESNGVELDRNYDVKLELSSSYEEQLTDSIQNSLYNFFVASIVSKWFKFINKDEAKDYAGDAAGMMSDIVNKIYYRKKPKRIAPR